MAKQEKPYHFTIEPTKAISDYKENIQRTKDAVRMTLKLSLDDIKTATVYQFYTWLVQLKEHNDNIREQQRKAKQRNT